MNQQYKTPGFLVSLALHGGLAAVLLGQQTFDSTETTIALPLKMDMFEIVQQVKPVVESAITEEIIEKVFEPQEVVKAPEPEPEPVVKPEKKIVKKQVNPEPVKRPEPVKPQVAAAQPVASPIVEPDVAEADITSNSNDGDKDLIRQMYKQQLLKTIAEHKYYPKRARRRHIEGRVEVGFVVMQDGVIENIRVADSSGESVLDKAALDAIRRAGRFDPIPIELGLSSWTFTVPLEYRFL
jgi:protein TonB